MATKVSGFLSIFCRSPWREICAEFLGTFILVVCGNGVMATLTLAHLGSHSVLLSSLGWGLALMIAVAISGGISGGHVNPAVTLAMATVKKCPWKLVLPYITVQYLASFLAACVVYILYADAIFEFDGGMRQLPPSVNSTAQIFSTFPQDFASIGTCFLDQVVGTALLLLVISTAADTRNLCMSPQTTPIVIGLGLVLICLAFGHNCGAALNPARDLSPRLFTIIAGWGVEVFSFRDYKWFWVPVVAPHLGGIIGVWLYRLFIELSFTNYRCALDQLESMERTANNRISELPFNGNIDPPSGCSEKSSSGEDKSQYASVPTTTTDTSSR
ncbi:aquaporin-9-like [Stegodyphus dumicola]|uniref:aquaporin-9-like n=1 Tax=Stegodyphus dumicola TaxID=202533 RepID=UPI0015B19021|nr:aquaporin-9-like [Stegodyphus dumicola]